MNNFQNDVFISFTHIDNPRIMKQEGWVSRFHDALEPLLSTRLGTPARIWRDRDLRDGDVLSKKVIDELRRSAIMLSIVTPRYLNSGWCQREVDEFSDHAKNTGGMIVGNAQRLVPVVKTPIDGPIPDFLKDVRFNNFFSRESGAPKEFDEIYGESQGRISSTV